MKIKFLLLFISSIICLNSFGQVPNCATTTSPLNGITAVTTSGAVLRWSAPSGGGTVAGYLFFLGTDAAATNIVNGTSIGNVLTTTLGTLLCNQTYFWRVVPFNATGSATGCSISSFSTDLTSNTVNQSIYYPLNGNANDASGNGRNGTLINSPTSATDRNGNPNSAYNFNGSNQEIQPGYARIPAPASFTISLWFNTRATIGGKIVGFGNSISGISTQVDRHLYMSNSGNLIFGVFPGTFQTIAVNGVNDGRWHHVVASLGTTNGMSLYFDGVLVNRNSSVISAFNLYSSSNTGFWRIANDALSGWTQTPSSNYFNGQLDDIQIFNREVSQQEIPYLMESAINNGPGCSGSSNLILSAASIQGASNYAWSGPNGFIANTRIATVPGGFSSSTAGIYTVNFNYGNGCNATYTTTVNSNSSISNNSISGSFVRCFNSPTTLIGNSPIGGDGLFYTYIWQSSTTSSTTGFVNASGINNEINYTINTLSSSTWFRRIAYSGGCFNVSQPVLVSQPLTSSSITSWPKGACVGETMNNNIFNANAVTGGGGGITYQWQYSSVSSTLGSSFVSLSGSNAQSFTPNVVLTATSWFRRVVTSTGFCSDTSATVQVTVYSAPQGNPTVNGSGIWMVYGYNANNGGQYPNNSTTYSNYAGFYTVPGAYTFETRTQWAPNETPAVNNGLSPSYTPGYQGCYINRDQHSYAVKGTNIITTTGLHQINIISNDDNITLRLNNNLFHNTGWIGGISVGGIYIGPMSPSDIFEFTINEGGGGSHLAFQIFPITSAPGPLIPGTISGADVICPGNIPGVLSNVTVPSGGCTLNFYTWQYSTDSTNWVNLSNSNSASYTPVNSVFQKTWYRRVVTDVCGQTAATLPVAINMLTPPGNSSVYGINMWNAYAFADQAWGAYAGQWTEPGLNFNSTVTYGSSAPPSNVINTTYQGCNIATNSYSTIYKRQGFPSGQYTIILTSDDYVDLRINGNMVYQNTGCLCGTTVAAWTGPLGPTDYIDFYHFNGPAGPGYLRAGFIPYSSVTGTLTGGVIGYDRQNCIGDVPVPLSNVTSSWAVMTAPNSTTTINWAQRDPLTNGCYVDPNNGYQWYQSNNGTNWTLISGATGTIYSPSLALTTTTYFIRVATDVCGATATSNFVTLTVGSAPVPTPTPTVGGTYGYGDGFWNVYGYGVQGLVPSGYIQLRNVNPTSFANYAGFYQDSTLYNFDTRNRWSAYSGPSAAVSFPSNYNGCTINTQLWAVWAKRTNIPAGTYQIDLGVDDDADLFINGTRVYVGQCCGVNVNSWTGNITTSTLIDIRGSNGNGPGWLSFTLTTVIPATSMYPGIVGNNQTVCTGQVPATLTSLGVATSTCFVSGYQWQSGTSTTSWANIVGATTTSFTPTAALTVTSFFRRLSFDACGNTSTSNFVAVTVTPPITPGAAGISSSAFCFSSSGQLSLQNPTGGTGSYGFQWQISSTSSNSGFSNYTTGSCNGVPFGAFLDICNLGSTPLSGTLYFRAILSSGGCSTVASNVVAASIFTAPGIVTQPNNISVCTGSNVQAIVPMSAVGIGLSYTWQECNGACGGGGWTNVANTANTTFTGANTNILTITGIVGAMNGRSYRVVVNSSCGSVTSTSINMTTNQPPLVVTQPTSSTVCGSGIISFNPVASGTTLRYQWLASSVVGGPFSAVSNGVPSGVTYGGVTTTSLNITTTGLTNYFYNLSIASSICNNSVTTNTVSITTNTIIGNNIMTVVSNLICNNATTTLLGSLPTGGNGSYTYQWVRSADDITFANATGGTSPTAQTYRPTPALTADTYFRRVVSSGVCTSTSTSSLISIVTTPVFTTQPVSVTTCVGNTVVYTAVATSTGNVSYQWQVNTGSGFFNLSVNANYPSVTSSTLTVVSFPASFLGNQYRAVATASCTSVNSNVANLSNFAAPTIDVQPVGSTSCSGGQIDVPYTVTGFQTALQWQTSTGAGWTNLSNFGTYGYQGTFGTAANRTQQALTFQIQNPLVTLNTSMYRVVLTGLCSNATSSSFTVTVQPAIANNGILISQNVCDGFPAGTITGSTPTGGSGTYTYNWLLSTGNIQATTPGTILIGGNYFVTIPGANGKDFFPGAVMTTTSIYIREANSSNCVVSRTGLPYLTITVSSATVYVIEPTDAFVCNGANALFTSSAVGSGITYKWQFRTSSTSSFVDLGSASSLPGFSGGGSFTVNNRNLTITNPPLSMNGFQYRGIAQGNCVPPYDTTQIVTLYMNPVPAIITQPTSLAACANSTATFAVVATAAGALNYTWQISTSGTFVNTSTTNPYFGATTSSLGVGVALNMNGNQFRSILTLGNCSVTTSGATLTTLSLAGITSQPLATTVCGGNTSSFSVVATGSGLSYQWLVSSNGGTSYSYLLNDGTYSGTSTNTLTIANTPAALNGNLYSVLVTGTCNTVTSNGVNLGVYSLPTIITQPANRLVCSGGNTTFITSASGLGIGYQWQLSTNSGSSWTNITNGGVYSQTTTNTLSITGVSVGMLGYQYRALLTATCFPTVTSSSATLTAAFASTWNGSVNSNWFNVANWCSQIPTATSNVAIQSSAPNMPVITSTGAICADIQIGTGASLTLNGSNSLTVFGSWRNDGTFIPNSGTVSFNGTGTQSISGSVNYSFNNLTINNSVAGVSLFSNTSVAGTFTLGNASLFNTNGNSFTLVSTSIRTARMASVPSNASFIGNLTMQRYIPAKPTVRFMSSAVNGATLQDWKNTIPVTGIGGSANGFDDSPVNLNTVWWFDETINTPTTFRFVAASNISMALTPGRGYRVYIRGDRSNIVPSNWSTYVPQPAVMSVTNTPNIGTISLPVSYTNYFAPYRDGTNLVGNPYPSEIDWDSPTGWVKTNIDNALYMFDPNLGVNGQYYYYVSGVASPARTNPSIIPSSQGFFVKANTASPSLVLNENAKVNVSHTGNFRVGNSDLNLIRIGVYEGNTFDESVLRFDASATDGFDKNLEAVKIYNSAINVYTSIAKDFDLSINAVKPSTLSQKIPVTVFSNKRATHKMLITKSGSLLDSMDVYLKDNYAGNYQLVTDSTWYTFVVNSEKASQGTTRFELVTARKEIVTQIKDKFNITPTLKVYPNPTYNEPTTLELYNLPIGKYALEVVDTHGKIVFISNFESTDSKYFATNLDLSNVLASGVYTIKVNSNIISEKHKLVIIK